MANRIRKYGLGWRGIPALALALSVVVAHASTIRLSDGSLLTGEILSQDDSTLTFRTKALGDLKIRRSLLVSRTDAPVSAQEASPDTGAAEHRGGVPSGDPSDQALFFLPTAFMPPQGAFVFRDFELLFMTLGYSPTAMTSLSAGFLFPVSSDLQLLTVGLKQQLWKDRGGRTALAVTGNFTKPLVDGFSDVGFLVNTNLVGGYRIPIGGFEGQVVGFHAAMGYLGVSSTNSDNGGGQSGKWEGNFSYGAGFEADMTANAKFMVEYLSLAPFDTGNDFEGGVLTLGIRLHGACLSADIAGIRPITRQDVGSFILWPLLVVSYRI